MDAIIALVVLVALALPVGVIVLFITQSGLRRRLQSAEARLALLEAAREAAPPVVESLTPEPAPASGPDPVSEGRIAAVTPWERALGTPSAPLSAVDAPPAPQEAGQDRPLVLRADRFAALAGWLRENWVYAVSALSLALAGVFFVQYGVEKGLLPPPVRVVLAVLFGAGLIVAGEWVRRRWGDDTGAATAYLPSVFSGAGIVAMFAGVTAGRLMYGLYGPGPTFAGLFLTSALAIWLGWRHGPFLAAIGLIGAAAAPFLVDGAAAPTPILYAHYLLVAATGLAIDAWRRWAWISVLALVLAQVGLWLMAMGGAGLAAWGWSLVALVVLSIIIPERALIPRHEGPSTLRILVKRLKVWPTFPVRLALGNLVASTLFLVLLVSGWGAEGLLPFFLLAGLAVLLLIWAGRAPGLEDLPLLPAAGFLAKLVLATGQIYAWQSLAIDQRPPESSAPWTVSLLVVAAGAITLAAALRSLRGGGLLPALIATLAAPVAILLLEFFWAPSAVLGTGLWAAHAMALAAGMTLLAAVFAKADGQPGRRSAWAVLSALSLIALALFLLTTAAALTLALAVLLLVAVALDRRFTLPEMGWFVQVGAAVLSWRLVVDPGLDWGMQAPLPQVALAYLGVAAACLAGLRLLPTGRALPKAVLESLGLAAPVLLVNLVLTRAMIPDDPTTGIDWTMSHWGLILNAIPWAVLAGTQLWRAGASGGLTRWLRLGLASIAALIALGGLAMALGPANPLFAWSEDPAGRILGVPLLDTLALAYGLPGLALLLLAPRLVALPARGRLILRGAGAALLLVWAVLEIRRLWWGDWIGAQDVMQGELYSYTLAMLALGAALLWQALARRSLHLQRLAMAVIALTVAKVFLWDASGLSGLTRVLSFAGLGLSLAGLAWLNRWARGAMAQGSEPRD